MHGWKLVAPATVALLTACSAVVTACSAEDEVTPESEDPEASLPDGSRNDGRVTPAGDAGEASASDASDASDQDATAEDAAPPAPLFAFVGTEQGKIRAFAVDATSGAWTLKRESNAGANPSFLAFDRKHRRVVAVDENGGLVRSFAFDPASGALSEVSTKPAGGAGTTHVSLDPTGAWAMVANYTGGTMSIFPLAASGALGNATDTRSSGPKSHWAGTNPSGTHVFVVSLGANTVAQYALDKATGKLTDNGVARPPANAGPRHLAFHPSEKWAYLVNEVAVTVTTFDFDKNTGKLSPKQTISALPPGQSTAGVSGAEIVAHPGGKNVYVSTRIYNSIAQLKIDATNGTLTRVANVPTGGNRPRSFGIDPEGTLLFAANQDRDEVVGYRIDALTGALTSMGKSTDVPGPSFVGLARIP